MVEGVQQGAVLVGTFFMVAEDHLPHRGLGPSGAPPKDAAGADRRVRGVDAGLGSPRRAKMLRTESPCRTWARHEGPGLHV